MRVSVVIPTVDRQEAAYNLLRHLEYQTVRPHEIIVVDQTAEPSKRLSEYAGVRYLRLRERGLPNARNVGAAEATGDVVLFVDDDAIPVPKLVEAHAAAYADATVGGVGGRLVGGYDTPDPRAPVGAFLRNGTVVRNFQSTERREVRHLPGGNMSFRRDVLERVRFDTSFGGAAIGEETDFCLRAARTGCRFVFEPEAEVEHLLLKTGGVYGDRFNQWVFWQAHNSMLFTLRHARAPAWPLFVLRRVARFCLHALEHASPVP
ncbi:MAG: glycosyltransferase family 2 protein, partial [Planctomycetota bacterium]